MNNGLKYLLLLTINAIVLVGCNSDAIKRIEGKPKAYGNVGKINVIAEDDLWNSQIKDTIDYYYASAFLILPQPEPIFDIRHLTPTKIKNAKEYRKSRCYMVIANLENEDALTTKLVKQDIGEENYNRALTDATFTTKVAKDRWAQGQIVIYVWGRNQEELIKNLKINFSGITKRIHKFDETQYEATVYFGRDNGKAEVEIASTLGVRLRVPQDYVVALKDSSMVWLRKETNEVSMNVMLYKVKYKDQEQLTKAGLKQIRNAVGKNYVSSTTEGSYMRINDVDLPLYVDPLTLDNSYALRGRGIWDIVNDFMGGAFVTYLIHDEKKGELIFLDGFVHAPGEDKKLHMQHLDYILRTVRL